MQNEKRKSKRVPDGELMFPDAATLLKEHIAMCKDLLERMVDHGRAMNEKEMELLRIAMVPHLRSHIDEAIFFFASGHTDDAAHTIRMLGRAIEKIAGY